MFGTCCCIVEMKDTKNIENNIWLLKSTTCSILCLVLVVIKLQCMMSSIFIRTPCHSSIMQQQGRLSFRLLQDDVIVLISRTSERFMFLALELKNVILLLI